MKKIIACVDSYYQLLVAMNLRFNKYRLDKFDLILINSTQNAEAVYRSLKISGAFDNVYLINSDLNINKLNTSFCQRIPKYYDYIYSITRFEKYSKEKLNVDVIPSYDFFLFNGYKPLIQCLFNAFYKTNNKIRCYRIDDGTATYIQEWCVGKSKFRLMIEQCAEKFIGFKGIENFIMGFFVPEISLIKYKLPYKLLNIPSYSNPELIGLMNNIFKYDKEQIYSNKRVVYFGGFGKFGIDLDYLFLNEILKFFPKESILIKQHPRESDKIYDILGIDTVKQPSIPWELFMLNSEFNDTIFISFMSSAVLSSRIIFNRKGIDIYLYNCKRQKEIDDEIFDKFTEFIENYKKEKNLSDSIMIPSTLNSFAKELEKLCPS